MNILKKIFYTLLLILPLSVMSQNEGFPLPDVPVTLKGPEARANYLALHYWDRYDFSNLSLIGNKDVSEQGFSNFISIMPYVTKKEVAFAALASRMVSNSRMLRYFMGLATKYLAEPLSPVYNENLYIMFLESIIAQQGITGRDLKEAELDLAMAKKNRIGAKAENFDFLLRGGKRGKLDKVKGEYIILLLGDPDCDICSKVKNEITTSNLLSGMIDSSRIVVLSVCVEGKTDSWLQTTLPDKWINACDDKQLIYRKRLYDIPGLPVLYLLDKEHRVLMKNIQVTHLEQYFSSR
ncbi:MAG: DUF5106 domain-containing protein [Bacteroidales bacterium]|nr:DUF5106 domain-containing protein [Bacteroidales bacterium]